MKIPHFGTELFQTEGQTDLPNVIFAFRKFCEHAKNEVANILMPRTLRLCHQCLRDAWVADGTLTTFTYSWGPYIFQKSRRCLQISCARVATRNIFHTEEPHFMTDT